MRFLLLSKARWLDKMDPRMWVNLAQLFNKEAGYWAPRPVDKHAKVLIDHTDRNFFWKSSIPDFQIAIANEGLVSQDYGWKSKHC